MTKVTYLFGAGASCQVLPLANDKETPTTIVLGLSRSMITLAKELKDLLKSGKITFVNSIKFIESTITKLEELPKKAAEFNSIDDYAKYLFINNSAEIEELKITLSRYFIIEQLYNRKFDKRYITFLNKVLKRKIFPSNIKILTWNYDFQMEIAGGFFEKEDFSTIGNVNRRKLPLINYYPPIGYDFKKDDYQLVHLNGIAGHSIENDHFINNLIYYDLKENRDTIFKWISKQHQLDQCLNFAWENNNLNSKSLNIAKSVIIGTDILVIIGYSFPDYNYEIDFQLFDILTKNNSLKIHFQDPYRNGQFLIERFNLPKPISENIVWNKDKNQFCVPIELLRNV